jgi:Transglutaminase-like superfamily
MPTHPTARSGYPADSGDASGRAGYWWLVHLVDRTRASIQLVWLRLRLPGLLAHSSLDALLARLTRAEPERAQNLAGLERALDRAEAWADRVPLLPRTCLYQCLARYAVLRRHGFPVEFVMGISPRGPDEDGHAWLELDGKPYREERAGEFVVSFRYPARVA